MTYIIAIILGEKGEPLLQKDDEMVCHLIEFSKVAVGVDIAETCSDRLVHKEQVGKLVPRAVVVYQIPSFLDPVGTDLHQCAVHTAASGPAVDPYNSPLSVSDVTVLVMPKEQVAIGRRVDFNVPVAPVSDMLRRYEGGLLVPCVHLQQRLRCAR